MQIPRKLGLLLIVDRNPAVRRLALNLGGYPVYQDLTKTVASKAKLPTSGIMVESRFFIESFYESILDKNRRNPSVDNTTSEGGDWLEDDIRFLQRAGVDVLVSALTPAEAEELGLLEEGSFCQRNGLEFLSFPIEDRSVPPSFDEFDALLNSVTDYLRNGKAIGIHCRAGIGRSSMIVASALIRTGVSVDSAFRAIQKARGCSVPDTPEQRHWVERYSTLVGRGQK